MNDGLSVVLVLGATYVAYLVYQEQQQKKMVAAAQDAQDAANVILDAYRKVPGFESWFGDAQ